MIHKGHRIHVFTWEGRSPVQQVQVLFCCSWKTMHLVLEYESSSGFGSTLVQYSQIPSQMVPFHLLPSVSCFWSVIMNSSNMYFQFSRSPTLRNCRAHSTTAACSFFAISDRRELTGFNVPGFQQCGCLRLTAHRTHFS